jgi:arylsulfatase A-like enzyme
VSADNPAVGRAPVSPDALARAQVPTLGLGFDHDLAGYGRVSAGGAKGYFGGIYRSPLVDELTNDLALAFLGDARFALGQGDAPDLLAISYSAHDPVAHDYGDESEESLDALRRLDVQIGRLLEALDAKFPAGGVLVALSADHGFPVLPEVARTFDRLSTAGRIDVSCETPGNFLVRLNRLLDEALCLAPGTTVVGGQEGWDLFYDHKAFPLKTVAGACGRPGSTVTAADVDRVLPGVIRSHWEEEIEETLPVSTMASWPLSTATAFAKNDFDRERSGDAFLIPRWGVMNTYSPGRGAMHGSPYEYDIHVPFVLWGAGIRHEESCIPVTPYQLAPTVGRWLGVALPDAVGMPLDLPK